MMAFKRYMTGWILVACLLTGCSAKSGVTPTDPAMTNSAPQSVTTQQMTVGDTNVTIVDTDQMNMDFDDEDLQSRPHDKNVASVDLNQAPTTQIELKPSQTIVTSKPTPSKPISSVSSAVTSQSQSRITSSVTSVTPPPAAAPAEVLNIRSGGTYTLSGVKTDSMVTVDAGQETVQLILNGVTVQNSKGPALYVRSAGKVEITLAAGTVNRLSDGTAYSLADDATILDAALLSRSDLVINGNGKLVVQGNYKHGIVSKDDLVLSSATVEVTAAAAGIEGKDCVKIHGGTYQIKAGSDGIRSDNIEDVTKGFVYLSGGKINIQAENDGIQAETVLKAEDTNVTVISGGGSDQSAIDNLSHKGLKAGLDIVLNNSTVSVDARDDAIHSNGTVAVAGGQLTLASGDDGIHADTDLVITQASTRLTVVKSVEGLEGSSVVIDGGTVSVTASKDGISAATTADSFTSASGKIAISGGKVTVKADGDGLDAKQTIAITGGVVSVSCANQVKSAMVQYTAEGTVHHATFFGIGAYSAGKALTGVDQGSIWVATGEQKAGTAIVIQDENGKPMGSYQADQTFASVLFSSPNLVKGKTYLVTAGSFSTTVIAQ